MMEATMVEITMVEIAMVEIAMVVEITMMKSKVLGILTKELPKTSFGAVMMALEISASAVTLLSFFECLALHQHLLHRLRAHVMTLLVLAPAMALQSLFSLCFHVRAAGQWALLVATMVMAARPVALHDGNGLLAGLLESHPEWFGAFCHAFGIPSTLLLADSEL